MAQTSGLTPKGGRPPQLEVPAPILLDRFVEYERKLRRDGRWSALSRAGFARELDKTEATLRGYLTGYNLPWPPVCPGELVMLLGAAVPNELLWISDAWCELTGRARDNLIWQPVSYLREIGLADGPREEHRIVAQQLRANPRTQGTAKGWIIDGEQQRRPVEFEIRHGHRSDAFYIRATLLEARTDDDHNEVFNVVPGIILRRKTLDQVDLVDLEQLLANVEADWDASDPERAALARQQVVSTIVSLTSGVHHFTDMLKRRGEQHGAD